MAALINKLLALQNVRGQAERVESLLSDQQVAVESLSPDDLLNLICNELRLRKLAGEAPELAEYQKRFPHIHQELMTQWQVDALLALTLPSRP